MITPALCLEARKLLGWSPERLSPRCGTSHSLLRRFEAGEHPLNSERLAAIRRAFEEAGVEFTNGDQPSVKLRKQR